jgi:hypothetical protein
MCKEMASCKQGNNNCGFFRKLYMLQRRMRLEFVSLVSNHNNKKIDKYSSCKMLSLLSTYSLFFFLFLLTEAGNPKKGIEHLLTFFLTGQTKTMENG